MHETAEDLVRLQELLDRSDAGAGEHMHRIITPERRLTAVELSERLTGMSLLTAATVTADGRPLAGAVDGVFFRGAFHFGSAPDSVRMKHLRVRPQVSVTHLPGEQLGVTVHGRAVFLDVKSKEDLEFRQTLLEVYVPLYGETWELFLDSGPVWVRVDADRMFTFHMEHPPG